MFCGRINGLLGCGIDLFALRVLGLLHLELCVEFSPHLRLLGITLRSQLRRTLLRGLVVAHVVLRGPCLVVHRGSLVSAFLAGFCGLDASLLRLGIGNCFGTVGVHAIAGLGLLELALGSQRVVAGYRADNFFRLAFHRVDQAFPRLTGLVMLRHLSLLMRQSTTPTGACDGFRLNRSMATRTVCGPASSSREARPTMSHWAASARSHQLPGSDEAKPRAARHELRRF